MRTKSPAAPERLSPPRVYATATAAESPRHDTTHPLGPAAVLMLLAASLAPPAVAAVLRGTPEKATGIDRLDINGTLYNLTFTNFGRFNDRAQQHPEFLYGPDGATAARNALVDFLNQE